MSSDHYEGNLTLNSSFSGQNATYDGYYAEPTNLIDVVSLIWQSAFIVATTVLNGILLIILLFMIKERTYSNFCFISLTLSDMIVGALVLPMTLVWISVPNVNVYLGMVLVVVIFTQPQIGLYMILVLSWHRFKQLVWPAESTEEVTKLRWGILIGMWVVNYFIWTVILVVCVELGYYDYKNIDFVPPNFVIIILDLIFYIIPLILDSVLIVTTIYFIAARAKKRQSSKSKSTVLSLKNRTTIAAEPTHTAATSSTYLQPIRKVRFKLSRDKKAILCLVALGINYLFTQMFNDLCWVLLKYNIAIDYTAYTVSVWLGYSSSMFNPVIVFIFHDKVQAALKKMFCWAFAKKRDHRALSRAISK